MHNKRLHKVSHQTEFKSDLFDKVYYADIDDIVGYMRRAYLRITLTNGEVLKFYNITKMPEDTQQAIESAFNYNYDTVSSVTIPNTVTEINDGALTFTWYVKNLTIPASVEQFSSEKSVLGPFLISDEGGEGPKIETVEFLGENTKLGEKAFYYCLDLSGVTLPNNLTEIPSSCFNTCINLTSIELPSTLLTIGEQAFGRTAFRSITIPDSVTKIGFEAFRYCRNLTSVALPSSLQVIDSYAFGNTDLRTIVIPDSVTEIGNGAFKSCSNLTEIYYKGSAIDKFNDLWGATNATLITVF